MRNIVYANALIDLGITCAYSKLPHRRKCHCYVYLSLSLGLATTPLTRSTVLTGFQTRGRVSLRRYRYIRKRQKTYKYDDRIQSAPRTPIAFRCKPTHSLDQYWCDRIRTVKRGTRHLRNDCITVHACRCVIISYSSTLKIYKHKNDPLQWLYATPTSEMTTKPSGYSPP